MAVRKYPEASRKYRDLLSRRGYNPKFYVVVRVLNYSVFFKDVRTGKLLIIDKIA